MPHVLSLPVCRYFGLGPLFSWILQWYRKSRNCLVFEKKNVEPLESIKLMKRQWCQFEELKQEKAPCVDRVQRQAFAQVSNIVPICWTRPPFRTIKVNCDGAWVKASGRGGYG